MFLESLLFNPNQTTVSLVIRILWRTKLLLLGQTLARLLPPKIVPTHHALLQHAKHPFGNLMDNDLVTTLLPPVRLVPQKNQLREQSIARPQGERQES